MQEGKTLRRWIQHEEVHRFGSKWSQPAEARLIAEVDPDDQRKNVYRLEVTECEIAPPHQVCRPARITTYAVRRFGRAWGVMGHGGPGTLMEVSRAAVAHWIRTVLS